MSAPREIHAAAAGQLEGSARPRRPGRRGRAEPRPPADLRAAAGPLLARPRVGGRPRSTPTRRSPVALLTRLVARRGRGVRRAPGRPAPPRPAPAAAPPTGCSSRGMFGYACYADRFAGDLAGCRQAPRPPRGARRHLPAPDAAARAAGGRQRRRLRRAGLPLGPARPRHHRRPARRSRPRCAARASAWSSTWCSTTSPASTTGRCAPGRARRRYRDYFHVFADRDACPTRTSGRCPRSSRTSRPAASPGTTSSTAGSGRRSTSGSGTSTGPTPPCSPSSPTIILWLANLGVEVLRLDAIAFLWKRMGTSCQNQPEVHAITQALRARDPDRGAGGGVQGRGDRRPARPGAVPRHRRHAGRVSDLAYHNSLMVQIWSMLASRQQRSWPGTPWRAAADPAVGDLDHLRPLPRRHRLGDRRLRRHAAGVTGPGTGTFLSDWYAGTFPGSWAQGLVFQANPETGDRRISGTHGRAGRAREGSDAGLEAAVARILLAHAVAAGWGGVPVVWSGDELAQPNDPDWADEEGHEDDNRWAHRPRLDWTRAARPARPADRARPGLLRAGAPGAGPRRAAAAARVAPSPACSATPTTACWPWSGSTPSGAFVGLYNVTAQPAAVPAAPAARGRAHHAVRRAGRSPARGRRRRGAVAPGVRRLVGRGRAQRQ